MISELSEMNGKRTKMPGYEKSSRGQIHEVYYHKEK